MFLPIEVFHLINEKGVISLDCFTTSASIVDPGYASKAVN